MSKAPKNVLNDQTVKTGLLTSFSFQTALLKNVSFLVNATNALATNACFLTSSYQRGSKVVLPF